VRRNELTALGWACLYYFCVLSSYYIIRPIRDEMGIVSGVENLQWLFLATFLAMLPIVPLFGWLVAKSPRSRFLPYAYGFFVLNLVFFYLLFRADDNNVWVARVFYVWVSVFNLFVVSVFWSFMTDIFNDKQAKRLFGFIAVGGTLGAVAGPSITALLVESVSIANLLLISGLFLGVCTIAIRQLSSWELHTHRMQRRSDEDADPVLKGRALDGIVQVFKSRYLLGICLLMVLYSTLSTFLYFQQAEILRDAFSDSAARTKMFAYIDLGGNLLTLVLQVFLTGRIVRHFGVPVSLAVVPVLLALGLLLLGFAPTVFAIVAVQVLRRAGNYALMRPARELLYVVLPREQKYRAKNFIDTTVYRGADVAGAWMYTGLITLGLGLGSIALVGVPLAAIWAWVSFRMGRAHDSQALFNVSRASARPATLL